MHFIPTKDFWSDETRSGYMKGFSYSVEPSNRKLAALVEQWASEGKVKTGGSVSSDGAGPAASAGRVSGKGTVK